MTITKTKYIYICSYKLLLYIIFNSFYSTPIRDMLFYLTPYMDKNMLHEFCTKYTRKRRINKFEKNK